MSDSLPDNPDCKSFDPTAVDMQRPVWTILCSVVDNFGDIGVCWRLARQLQSEYGCCVHLWLDDLEAFARFQGEPRLSAIERECLNGVEVRRWSRSQPISVETAAEIAESAVIIEAFGCELSKVLVDAMALHPTSPLWINLEYLSAESWVLECHGLQSLISTAAKTLTKTFFFPGFVDGTGGLLREQGLIARHEVWQKNEELERTQFLLELGLGHLSGDHQDLLFSVFTYESAALESWIDALAQGPETALCLIPEGRVLASIAPCFGFDGLPAVGDVLRRGVLIVAVIPFLSQFDYDRLLSLCDFNLVRGEDSFVRAQWAGKPFLWHIYPQQEDVHLQKLDAFLTLYMGAAEGGLRQFWRCWNLGEDCGDLWHYLRPQLPRLREQAREWRRKLAEMPDLAGSLVQLYRNTQ